jgi:hypothetical protein
MLAAPNWALRLWSLTSPFPQLVRVPSFCIPLAYTETHTVHFSSPQFYCNGYVSAGAHLSEVTFRVDIQTRLMETSRTGTSGSHGTLFRYRPFPIGLSTVFFQCHVEHQCPLRSACSTNCARSFSNRSTILTWHVVYYCLLLPSRRQRRQRSYSAFPHLWDIDAGGIFWNTTPHTARVTYEAISIGTVYFDVAKDHDFTMETVTSLSRAH